MRVLSILVFSLCTIPSWGQSGPDLAIDSTYYSVPANAKMPREQVTPQRFVARVHNLGDVPVDSVLVTCSVEDPNTQAIFGVWEQIVPILEVGDSVDILFNEEPFDYSGMLDWSNQDIEFVYTVSSALAEENLENNARTAKLFVDRRVMAKETGRTTSITLSGRGYHYIGNVFYLPDANSDVGYFQHIGFQVENAADFVELDNNGTVVTLLYETDGDTNSDGFIDLEEYGINPIRFNEYRYVGDEADQLIYIPVDLDEEPLPLQSGKYYVFAISVWLEEGEEVQIGASDEVDYAATIDESAMSDIPQYGAVYGYVPGFDTLQLELNPFGTNIVPMIRFVDVIIDKTEEPSGLLPASYQMRPTPNPASERCTVHFSFPMPQSGVLELLNAAGQVLQRIPLEGILEHDQQVDLSKVSSGLYLLRFSCSAGQITKPLFIKS